MIHQLNIETFLPQSRQHLILDVRSEGEHNYGHIPGSVNLPLFNNEERKIVGTIYKQTGRQEAILRGLDIAGKKMSDFVRFVQERSTREKVFVHCWRGGMRSEGMAWLMNLYGYEVFVLKGGYKSYRRRVLDILAKKFLFLVIGGRTGSGKTEILQQLKNAGEQVIDLEALAHHKGSAFGALGQPAQPSTEHFENLLAAEMEGFNPKKPVWLEDEAKTIGRVFLDLNFWNNMQAAPLFVIETPVEERIKKLVATYGSFSVAALQQSFTNIQKRLGNEQCKNAIAALNEGNITQAAEIAIHYYDKAYDKALTMKKDIEIKRVTIGENILEQLLEEAKKRLSPSDAIPWRDDIA